MPDSNTYENPYHDPNSEAEPDPYGHGYADGIENSNSHAHWYSPADRNTYYDGYVHGNTDRYRNTDIDSLLRS
jgi:hypothetical protein